MKKRKGLLVIIVLCIVSFVATIALGIACIFAFGNGRLDHALREFTDRYHLSVHFDIPDYSVDYYGDLPSMQTPDADNRIDLSVIPQGSDLEIECDNLSLTVRSGDMAAAKLTFAEGSQSLSTDQYRFELFRTRENSNRYLLVFDFDSPLWVNAQVNPQLDVTLPNDLINRLDIDCGNSAVTLSGIACSILTAESDNGSITAENLAVQNTVDLNTDSGILQLKNPAEGASITCEVDNGEIWFNIGELAYYTIDAEAENGIIINNLSSTPTTVGDHFHYQQHREDGYSGTRLYFQTDNGNINLNP